MLPRTALLCLTLVPAFVVGDQPASPMLEPRVVVREGEPSLPYDYIGMLGLGSEIMDMYGHIGPIDGLLAQKRHRLDRRRFYFLVDPRVSRTELNAMLDVLKHDAEESRQKTTIFYKYDSSKG